MKKVISAILSILILGSFFMAVFAAEEGPEIILQPQSPNYPEYSVAIYTVKANGANLSATWYMEWLGDTYIISNLGGSMQPWEPYAGESYGARKLDDNTFAFIFEGIEYDMDGAYIWCVIEDGHYDVTSQKARISVGNPCTPPQIIDIPSHVEVEQGMEAVIRCIAKAPDNTQLSFRWYETDTGKMEDMRAVNRGTETTDYLFLDTSSVGTRYYLCCVETTEGGIAYSSIVTVTVTEPAIMPDPPEIMTDALPKGVVGEPYSATIACSDPNAELFIYYNPGGANEFSKTGLVLEKNGKISGIPNTVGSFSFCVCAANVAGEDYMVYTVNITEAVPKNTEATTNVTKPTVAETETGKNTPPETKETQAATPEIKEKKTYVGIPWWFMVIIGIAGIGVGVGVTFVLVRKK